MGVVTNSVDTPSYDHVTGLRLPEIRAGITAPNGDAAPWKNLPIGTMFWVANDKNPENGKWYRKLKNDQRDDDWRVGLCQISQRILFSQFTDGGAAIGTFALTEQIPAGAQYQRTVLRDVTGFTGNVSATIQVGDGTDVDRYSTGTPSVFTTAVAIDPGAPSGTAVHVAAVTVTITITASSDFTAVAAGAFTIDMYYYL
jgi:hypothetical protein